MNRKENLSKVLKNYSFEVASIDEVPGTSGAAFRVHLLPGQSYKALKRLGKDIALSLNVKSVEMAVTPEYAVLKISE